MSHGTLYRAKFPHRYIFLSLPLRQQSMESFVARHVLIKLLFDGDLDGLVVDPNTGNLVKGPKLFGFFNRRRYWTLVIYVATLVPAVIVNDLGPVLSITGAIGGCSLAYIGPGLVYLGSHGDAFLSLLAGTINGKNKKATTTPNDLPLEGDPRASMHLESIPQGPKPWWWWPLLMPFWVHVAASGSQGMNERMTALEQEHAPISSPQAGLHQSMDIIPFRKRDACFSIFFIVFGITALVAGILSNVYVQVHDIFFSPS